MKHGGPAFPSIIPIIHNANQGKDYPDYSESGMTLRDYFAAQALPAIIDAYVNANGSCIGAAHTPPNTAFIAYAFADAMLERKRKTDGL